MEEIVVSEKTKNDQKPNETATVGKMIAFVNPKSGGRQGEAVLERLKREIGEANVYDLTSDHGPKRGLEENHNVQNLQIIACGGDGTVGWVLSVLDNCAMAHPDSLSVGVIPLGTGNDMARFLGCGSGYRGGNLQPIVQMLRQSQARLLDRWKITTDPENIDIPQPVFNNYLSFGADAEIALQFHERRQRNPQRYSNQFFNKLAYGCISCNVVFSGRYLFNNIGNLFDLEIDGKSFHEELQRFRPDAVLILNIRSYAAGTNPWHGSCDGFWCANSQADEENFHPQSCSDGFLEVIGFRELELARIQCGRRAHRLGQGERIRIIARQEIPMEIDGEPFRLKPCTITIERKNQARMIATERSKALAETRTSRNQSN